MKSTCKTPVRKCIHICLWKRQIILVFSAVIFYLINCNVKLNEIIGDVSERNENYKLLKKKLLFLTYLRI